MKAEKRPFLVIDLGVFLSYYRGEYVSWYAHAALFVSL